MKLSKIGDIWNYIIAMCIKYYKCLIILSMYFIEPRPEVNKLRPRDMKKRNLKPDEPPAAVDAID